MIVEFFITEDGLFAYRYKASNGKVLVTSHGYKEYHKCTAAWNLFEASMLLGPVPRIRFSKELINR